MTAYTDHPKAPGDGRRTSPTRAKRPTALGIPCPWSGDENDPTPRRYWAWFWLYRTTRVLRHRIGLHDFQWIHALNARRCTWCGHQAA